MLCSLRRLIRTWPSSSCSYDNFFSGEHTQIVMSLKLICSRIFRRSSKIDKDSLSISSPDERINHHQEKRPDEDAADPFEHTDVSFSVDCVSTLTVSIDTDLEPSTGSLRRADSSPLPRPMPSLSKSSSTGLFLWILLLAELISVAHRTRTDSGHPGMPLPVRRLLALPPTPLYSVCCHQLEWTHVQYAICIDGD